MASLLAACLLTLRSVPRHLCSFTSRVEVCKLYLTDSLTTRLPSVLLAGGLSRRLEGGNKREDIFSPFFASGGSSGGSSQRMSLISWSWREVAVAVASPAAGDYPAGATAVTMGSWIVLFLFLLPVEWKCCLVVTNQTLLPYSFNLSNI